LKKFHEQEIDKVTLPFLMILGGKDGIVSNEANKNFFDIASAKDKDIITYDDLGHMIFHDNEFLSLLSRDLIGWFDIHC
jgi:esterase/lipase